jgi:hypothetical protein
LEKGFTCFHRFLNKQVYVVPMLSFMSSDMMMGNPASGKLDCRHASHPCRHYSGKRSDLESPNVPCDNSLTRQNVAAIRALAFNQKTVEARNNILTEHGLKVAPSPLNAITTFLSPEQASFVFLV